MAARGSGIAAAMFLDRKRPGRRGVTATTA